MEKTKALYSKGEEIFNGVTHIIGGGLGILFLIFACIYGGLKLNSLQTIICWRELYEKGVSSDLLCCWCWNDWLFANQLNTVIGCVFFTLGVALLVGSIILVSKQEKDNK